MNDSPYVAILRDIFEVRDVSGEEDARRALAVPELAPAFEALGFRSVGFYRMGSAPGYVHEVWRSPDSRAFLTLEHDQQKRPRAELRTLLHDGTIIDTSSTYSGRARLFARARLHHPEAAYVMEISGASPEGLWRRHAERVEAVVKARSSTIPPHDAMRMQLALASRSMVLSFIRGMQSRRLRWTVLIPATIAIVAAVILGGSVRYWLPAVAVAGVAFWYVGEVSTWAVARLLHIPPVPLATLLAAVDQSAEPVAALAEPERTPT
ncbi:hypothetical protein [Hyalangium rubrum]|uniref:Uncharacterized protein n=1 Tax=Hyalangium rubrum TaxID=3103134 RepID=A0ABU5H1G5_9BACT|nr:hypothetical protein [Hyalangium sp. s54d21]MDY7227300.1 hypothetical protein [Hyalangium sp. s54d21]